MRTTLALMLRAAGYEVDDCGSGEEGKELGATGGYDLVITDLRLGAVDGLEVLRAVRDSVSNTEVIVMTAYGTIESAVEAMRLGAYDYLQKPFSEQELLLKRANVLEKEVTETQLLASKSWLLAMISRSCSEVAVPWAICHAKISPMMMAQEMRSLPKILGSLSGVTLATSTLLDRFA